MLDPSPLPPSLIPTSFLPPLPRSQLTLAPLRIPDILAHVALLRELYLPPIHGGFSVTDVTDANEEPRTREKRRERRFSAGLVDTMDGLGLDLEGVPSESVIREEQEEDGEGEDEDDEEEEEESTAHLDPFEREWAQRWLEGVVRRAQGMLEAFEEEEEPPDERRDDVKEVEAVLRGATAALAMMAGTSAAGSLTRHLLFPLAPTLAPYLHSVQQRPQDPSLSPETHRFLASLATSPTSPLTLRRASISMARRLSNTASQRSLSPEATRSSNPALSPRQRGRRRRQPAMPILLHDAPMGDHLSVGVQTWGSAILLGREMALRPQDFGLFPSYLPPGRGVRVLELGAGTGLLSILCRKLLDLKMMADVEIESEAGAARDGLVVATDFLPSVLDNLKVCVDLNFPAEPSQPSEPTTDRSAETGIHIAKLDWTTFPGWMAAGATRSESEGQEEMVRFGEEPFDLVLASDCVYDPTHAAMLRQVAGWVLRPPDVSVPGDAGGTFHILSPLRPTFAPELESIDEHFPPLDSYPPLSDFEKPDARGEGLAKSRGLKLGVRGEGKKGVKGRKGEGRVDEVQGYWWWEVGWG